jgi:hypothetical protein
MSEEIAAERLSRRNLLLTTAVVFLVALFLLLAAVLPAEFNRDPLGIGRVTGLSRLWSPGQDVVGGEGGAIERSKHYPAPARSDTIEIPLGMAGGGMGPYSLEYKVRMQKDAVLLYEWTAEGIEDPSSFAFEFHGHDLPAAGEKRTVSSYWKARGASGRGSLVAPFDGIHGWYFDNPSAGPVVVRLRVTGYYELVPPGQPGNEAGLRAGVPAGDNRETVSKGLSYTPGS